MNKQRRRPVFAEDGSLELPRGLTLAEQLDHLDEQIGLFLVHVDTCKRTEGGDYVIPSGGVGPRPVLQILWERVAFASSACITGFIPRLTESELETLKRTGVFGFDRKTNFSLDDVPLVQLFNYLTFAITAENGAKWRGLLQAANVGRVRALRRAIAEHRKLLPEEDAPAEPTPSDCSTADVAPSARPLTNGLQRVADAIEAACKLDSDLIPREGAAASEALWRAASARLPGPKKPGLESFRKYWRTIKRTSSEPREARSALTEPTRSMVRARDEARRE